MQDLNITIKPRTPEESLTLKLDNPHAITDYNRLTNKPSIEGHILQNDSSLRQIGVGDITPQDIDNLLFG